MISPASAHLATLPVTWDTARAKSLFFERDLRSKTGEEELFSLSKTRGLLPRSEVSDKEARADSLEGYKCFLPGDLVMTKMQAWNGVFGFSGVCSGIVSPDYTVFSVAPDIDARFYTYLFKTDMYAGVFEQLARGMGTAFLRLNTSEFGSVDVPVPPPEVQERIANFLDDKTARIDALIAEKERLSNTLVAMRRDAIDATVLGGYTARCGQTLNGLEVLGPIPQDWTSSRMKFELEYVTSGSRGWAEHYADDGALFVRIGNLTRDSIELDLSDIQRVALPDAAEGVRARVHPGDLLISITAYLGSVAVAPVGIEEAYVSQHVSLARPNCLRALPKWLGYVVLSSIGRTFFDLQAYGGTKVQLSLDDIRELPVPLPPTDVQRERINLLEARLCRLNELATHVQGHISRLREYRSSLISAAVTGQLDLGSFEAAKA